MDKLQVLLTQKLATRLEAVLAAQLDKALDAALDAAIDRLLGATTDTQAQPKAKTKTKAKAEQPQTEQPQVEQPQRVRATPTPQYPANYEQFVQMVTAAGLGKSKSGRELGDLWANRAGSLHTHYEKKGTPVPWGKLWALVAQDKALPTRVEGNARAIAHALGLSA